MLVVEAATFAGLIILVVEFVNIMTKARRALHLCIVCTECDVCGQQCSLAVTLSQHSLENQLEALHAMCRIAALTTSKAQRCTNGMLLLVAYAL